MSQKYQKKLKPKGMPCYKSTKLQFQSISTRKIWCSKNGTNQLKSNVERGFMCPRRNSGPPAVTLTKWLKWCVHARYMKVLSVTVSTFKRRMEKKLGERRETWRSMYRLIVSFGDCFTDCDIRRAYAFVLYWRKGVWWSSPGEILVEYVQNCDILDQLGQKLCLQKGIGCWTVGCIPSECFELTQKLFK